MIFKGYRGSRALGLETEQSDIDVLVVLKKDELTIKDKQSNVPVKQGQRFVGINSQGEDEMTVTLTEFQRMAQNAELEFIEAYFSSYEVDSWMMLDILHIESYIYTDEYDKIFKKQLFYVLRNQVKQYLKGYKTEHFLAKIYLYSYLLTKDNAIKVYRDGLDASFNKELYFKLKRGLKTETTANLAQVIKDIKNNVNRQTYIEQADKAYHKLFHGSPLAV